MTRTIPADSVPSCPHGSTPLLRPYSVSLTIDYLKKLLKWTLAHRRFTRRFNVNSYIDVYRPLHETPAT